MTPSDSHPPTEPSTNGLRCPNCGYDLTGLRSSVCPECGEEFEIKEIVLGGKAANTYIILSAAMLFFGGLLGIVPLIFSILAVNANSRYDYPRARRCGKIALISSIIVLALTALMIAVMIASEF